MLEAAQLCNEGLELRDKSHKVMTSVADAPLARLCLSDVMAFGADLLLTDQRCHKAWSVQIKTNAHQTLHIGSRPSGE
jgi:hypothetical protein